ncbi:hypothetical protein Hanom_Chr04g00324711 [Helianthus anomalus]
MFYPTSTKNIALANPSDPSARQFCHIYSIVTRANGISSNFTSRFKTRSCH